MSTPPTNYDRQYNFEDFQTLNPTAPLPGQEIEAELNNIELSVNQTILRLNELQNSDGSLKISSSLSAQTVSLATTTATAVAETATEAYLTANYDPTIASQAAASASAANTSANAARGSADLAWAHATDAGQAAFASQTQASQASTARAQARDYAIDANDSRNEALASEQSAAAHLAGTSAVYTSALQLKSNVDSQSNKFLNKREDLNHAAANMLFNGGDINNTLIEKIFPGTSFNSNAQLQQGQTIDNMGWNHVHGPWWVFGNAQPENPSDIITRDMMNCLVQTWKYWGPSVANGQMKPMSIGVNGEPNFQWHSLEYPQNIIKGIRYDQPDFNTNQMYPSQYADGVLTPLFVVEHKFNQAYSLAQTANSRANAALEQGGTLQASLAAYATTAALTSGLAGKANSSHTHTISNVSGLQAELNLKSSTSHNHDISGLTGLTSYFSHYQKRSLPVVYGNYAQDFAVSISGSLHILDYATDASGKVNFNSNAIGDRFYLYQSANAAYPIQLVGAINIDNKTFTRGGKSYVEAVSTPDGIVVSGDLMFPPNGTLLSSSCDYVDNLTDASGSASWSGNFYSNKTYADGSGGTYSTGAYNQDGCWYPLGFAISWGVNLSESTFDWGACGNSGTYTYSIGAGNILADGVGGTYQSYTGGWSAGSGDVIYSNGGSCVVRYDGNGGYYVEDAGDSGPNYDPYGTSLGSFGGSSFESYYDTYSGSNYDYLSYDWTEDRYADGYGSYYTQNPFTYYPMYGTVLITLPDDGTGNPYYVYADGNGSYFT